MVAFNWQKHNVIRQLQMLLSIALSNYTVLACGSTHHSTGKWDVSTKCKLASSHFIYPNSSQTYSGNGNYTIPAITTGGNMYVVAFMNNTNGCPNCL
jgi:hypothetical protein